VPAIRRAFREASAASSGTIALVEALSPAVAQALRALVDEYRDHCLWYLRRDYYPATRDEGLRVLDAIERHGSVQAFRRAAEIRPWLSPPSSATSAGS
jgi:hypothetical protein